MSAKQVSGYRANLLGHDAVTCCAPAENHFTIVCSLSADIWWLAGVSEVSFGMLRVEISLAVW